jgi:hypothetical protein
MALCKLLQQYASAPLPSPDPIIRVVSAFLTDIATIADMAAIVLQLILNICEWATVRGFADHITFFPQFLSDVWPDAVVSVSACRVLRRSFVLHEVTFGVPLSHIVWVALDDDRAEEARFAAAATVHAMAETSDWVRMEILSGGLLAAMLGKLESVSMKVRFHLAMTILDVADACTDETVGRFLEPPGSEVSFYQATPLLLAMENTFIFEGVIRAWERLLGLGGEDVAAAFFEIFPGDEIWEAFAVDDTELEAKADAFLGRWVQGQS